MKEQFEQRTSEIGSCSFFALQIDLLGSLSEIQLVDIVVSLCVNSQLQRGGEELQRRGKKSPSRERGRPRAGIKSGLKCNATYN